MPTINRGDDYFQAVTYTGNGSTNTITGLRFQPDFVWIKGRSGATDHALYDAVRGTTKDLVSNSTAAETTQSTGLTSFNSDGFTLGALSKVNTNGATYVAWCWKANGAGSSNTQGSITSTVSVSTTAGFSVVTYSGTLTSAGVATVGHGLGVAPKMIISKSRGTSQWVVQHASLTSPSYFLYLNTTDAQDNKVANGTMSSPTSTVFSTNWTTGLNTSGSNFVAYCFAEIAGFSKFGSYTGNGSADGPMVYLNFAPKFVMTKRTDTTSDWIIYDTSRNTYNVTDLRLFPNLSNAETQAGGMDLLSNGFKLRDTGASQNASGGTYIYMAFASNPFSGNNRAR